MRAAIARTALRSQHHHHVASKLTTNVQNTRSFSGLSRQFVAVPTEFRFFSSTTATATAAADNEDKKEATEEATEEAADPATEEEATPEEPVDPTVALEAQIKTLKDSLLRSLAEQENTRNIARRDVQSARDFAIKKFAKSLLDVSDNLSRAMDAVPDEARNQENPILSNLYEGIEMTEQGLLKAFSQNGLEKFCDQPGDVFDPTKHEALYEYADPEKVPGTVGQVMKVGFMLNDRVLRPAEVGVVKKV